MSMVRVPKVVYQVSSKIVGVLVSEKIFFYIYIYIHMGMTAILVI